MISSDHSVPKRLKSGVLWLLLTTLPLMSVQASDEDEDHWLDDFIDEAPLFDEKGLRSRLYRAPTPADMEEAVVLSTQQLQVLLEREPDTVLLNVLPVAQFGNSFVLKKDYDQVPGSIWLPNVGRGTIEPALEKWFFSHLDTQTSGDKNHPVVIYCQADCWMSWNAIKRAARKGYSQLYWYRNGMDGWREHALPVENAVPQRLGEG